MFRLAITSLAFSLVGCLAADGAGDEAIFVSKAVASSDTCSFTSSESEALIGHGEINVGSPEPYRLHPQMISRIDATADQLLQKTIQIHGARVNLEFADSNVGNAVPATQKQFKSLFSGPLSPNGGVTDGGFDVIPEGALAAILSLATSPNFETEVIAKVTVYGDLAGDEVTSQEFQFPITVCANCIVNVVGDCPLLMAGRQGNACNAFQDGIVDCCTAPEGVMCPGPVAQP